MACVIQQSYCPYLVTTRTPGEVRDHLCVKESALLCQQMTHYKGRDRVFCMDCCCIVLELRMCVSREYSTMLISTMLTPGGFLSLSSGLIPSQSYVPVVTEEVGEQQNTCLA